jgi:hypothetical protein
MYGQHETDSRSEDRCARCGRLIIEDVEVVHAEDGTAVAYCITCAEDLAAATGAGAGVDPATFVTQAEDLIQASIDRHSQEQEALRDIGRLLEDLAAQASRDQARLIEAEERVRALEGELAHARDLLQRAEELLVVSAGGAADTATDEECVAPHLPVQVPQVATTASSLTSIHVRAAQKAFNESQFIEKVRGVRRGLGRPTVNLSAITGSEGRTLLTIAWDIVWYQYLIDLSDDAPQQVALFGEGMELTELSENLRRSNAIIDDQGRLDASELELSLEADHPAHVTQQDEAAEQALDDATEELWDRTSMPEFRWDD